MSENTIVKNPLYRWIIYNAGLSILRTADFCMEQRSWVNTYNRAWHGSDSPSILGALDWLVVNNLLKRGAEEVFELADEGKVFWCKFAKPEWNASYYWKFDDPSCEDWDFRVEICAIDYAQLIAIVFEDINDCTYGVMDNANVVIANGITFLPLYWHMIAHGVSIAFNASVIPQSIDAVNKRSGLRLFSQKWYLSYEDAEAAWLEKRSD